METDFRSFENVEFEDPNDEPVDFEMPFGAEGTTNLGIGAGVVFDQRHNVLNERNAFFSEVAYLNYSPFWKDKVEYQSITSDSRFFKTLGKNNVIAAQLLGEFNFAGDVPFSQLSFMGGQNMMRGYFKGRFRDNNQIAAQVEYRMLPLDLGFSKRLGATIFTSVGDVFDDWDQLSSKDLKMAAGVGLRFLLFQQKDVYLRFDYAITPDENGFYIGVGEAF
ncbi:MAG: BamA/TamA family outer membrane protein [Psychroflexus sp.]